MTQNEALMASFPTPRVHEVRALTLRESTSRLVLAIADAVARRSSTHTRNSVSRATGGDR
jgi:hypothetical protein